MASLYRSAAGRTAVLRYYDTALARVGLPFEDVTLRTRFGDTHLLAAGPRDAPPLVIFHGGNVVNPASLGWFADLMKDHRVYAPDTIGHPGKSAETPLRGSDSSYGQWVVDLLDDLGLERATLIGPSFGGGIVLNTAALAPERIARAVLIVPSSLAMSIWRPVREVVLPMLAYRLLKRRGWLHRSVQPMFTEPVEDAMLDFVGLVYEQVNIHPQMPRRVTKADLARFQAPTLVLAAENDCFFPAHKVLPRARDVIPNVVRTEVLEGSHHYPSAAGIAHINASIRRFLAETR